MSEEIIIAIILGAIATFLTGFMVGGSLEYHKYKLAMQRQQETENKRLRGITALVNGERE